MRRHIKWLKKARGAVDEVSIHWERHYLYPHSGGKAMAISLSEAVEHIVWTIERSKTAYALERDLLCELRIKLAVAEDLYFQEMKNGKHQS